MVTLMSRIAIIVILFFGLMHSVVCSSDHRLHGTIGIGNWCQVLVPQHGEYAAEEGSKIVVSDVRGGLLQSYIEQSDLLPHELMQLHGARCTNYDQVAPPSISTEGVEWFSIAVDAEAFVYIELNREDKYRRCFAKELISNDSAESQWFGLLRRRREACVATDTLFHKFREELSEVMLMHAVKALICYFIYGHSVYVPYVDGVVAPEFLISPRDLRRVAQLLFSEKFFDGIAYDEWEALFYAQSACVRALYASTDWRTITSVIEQSRLSTYHPGIARRNNLGEERLVVESSHRHSLLEAERQMVRLLTQRGPFRPSLALNSDGAGIGRLHSHRPTERRVGEAVYLFRPSLASNSDGAGIGRLHSHRPAERRVVRSAVGESALRVQHSEDTSIPLNQCSAPAA